ncbi:MAG: hypothetical protein ACKN9U_16065 [Pirellulaceae bacterium]
MAWEVKPQPEITTQTPNFLKDAREQIALEQIKREDDERAKAGAAECLKEAREQIAAEKAAEAKAAKAAKQVVANQQPAPKKEMAVEPQATPIAAEALTIPPLQEVPTQPSQPSSLAAESAKQPVEAGGNPTESQPDGSPKDQPPSPEPNPPSEPESQGEA